MLITFAYSFIGVLLVFGNYKFLRRRNISMAVLVATLAIASAGTYFIVTSDMDNPFFLMAMFSPLFALIMFHLARTLVYRIQRVEIILYLGGFLPRRHEERFVSRLEKVLTFLITAITLLLAYLSVWSIVQWA